MSTENTSTSRLELTAFVLYAAAIGLVQFTIKAEILLGLAGLAWAVLAFRDGRRPAAPAFFVPLLALAAYTLVSAAVAVRFDAAGTPIDPIDSLQRAIRQLSLFLIVPVTMRVAAGSRASRVIDVVIALGSAAAIVAVVQYVTSTSYEEVLRHRPSGLLRNYMTYSGVLMLVICATVARLLFRDRDWVWPAVAIPALFVALAATLSRNVWVGTAVAIGALLSLRRRVLLVALPLMVVIAAAIAPGSVRERAMSAFNPHHPSNQDRFAMLKAGVAMVKDHPLFGVGMNMVPRVYRQYRTPDAVDSAGATGPETRSHLHNVPLQLAAERGLPALAIWLWFVIVAGRDLLRLIKRGSTPAVAAAGFGAVVAMLTAGLFEHNFGDSEFLILFLALISLPFAAERTTAR